MNKNFLLIFSLLAISASSSSLEKLEQFSNKSTNLFGLLLKDLNSSANPEEEIAEIMNEYLGFKSTKDNLNWISFTYGKYIPSDYKFSQDLSENISYFTGLVEQIMKNQYNHLISNLSENSDKNKKINAFLSFVEKSLEEVTEVFNRALIAKIHDQDNKKNLEFTPIINQFSTTLLTYSEKFKTEFNPAVKEGLVYREINGKKEYVNQEANKRHVDNQYVKTALTDYFNQNINSHMQSIMENPKSKGLRLIRSFLLNVGSSIIETLKEFLDIVISNNESQAVLKERLVSIMNVINKISQSKSEITLEHVHSFVWNKIKDLNNENPNAEESLYALIDVASTYLEFELNQSEDENKYESTFLKVKQLVYIKYQITNYSNSKPTTSIAFVDFENEVDLEDSNVLYLIYLNLKEVEDHNLINATYVHGLIKALPHLFKINKEEIEVLSELQSLLNIYLFDENDTSQFYQILLELILTFTKESQGSNDNLYARFSQFVDNHYENDQTLLFYFDIKFTIFTLLESDTKTLEFIHFDQEGIQRNKEQIFKQSHQNLKLVLNNIFIKNEGKKDFPLVKDESAESKLGKHIAFAQGKKFNADLSLMRNSKLVI